MMSNASRSTLYVGVTSNIIARVWQHKQACVDGFTKDYQCHDLVWFEQHETMESAISREKQLKRWRREKKDFLIQQLNPVKKDLYESLF
tara:strand:+ start:390 stop:656 length:267 start_codon:yes stop_codon:yes gene_type:complete